VIGQILVSDPSIPTNNHAAKHIPSLLQAPGLTIYFEPLTAEMRPHFNSYDTRVLFSSHETFVEFELNFGSIETENAAPEYDCFCGLHYLHLGSSNNRFKYGPLATRTQWCSA
jgi:hypothetical protein